MISIVIPTYNHAEFLPIQLASVIRQGKIISRIIVVNDCSTDGTTQILARIQLTEPRLLAVNLPKNVGAMRAASIGMQYIETEFFAFAAADDFLLAGWADSSLKALRSAPNAGFCVSSTFVVNDKSGDITKSVIPRSLRGKALSSAGFRQSLLRYGNWFSSNTTLYRRSSFDDNLFDLASVGAFFDGLSISIIGLRTGAVVEEAPLGVFFVRNASMSDATNAPHVGMEHLEALSTILSKPNYVDTFGWPLVFRLLRRNAYIYMAGAVHAASSQYSNFAKRHFSKSTQSALRIFISMGLSLYKICIFIALRPFDIPRIWQRSGKSATTQERHRLFEYRQELNRHFFTDRPL